MFETLKDHGTFKICNVYNAMLILGNDLGNEQDRKCGLTVLYSCVKLTKGSVVLASSMSTRHKVESSEKRKLNYENVSIRWGCKQTYKTFS